jgi:glycosyltransferase involved in cell wall biosynthesis
MRVLFLSRWFPYPPDNGSRIRAFNILRQLSRAHEVSLVSFAGAHDRVDDESIAVLRDHCRDVRVLPFTDFNPSSLRALAGLLSPRPRLLVDTDSAAMRAAVVDATARRSVDLVVACQLGMLPYALASDGTPAILEELELSLFLDAARTARGVRRVRPMLTNLKLRSYLRRALPRLAACTVVSEQERANVARAVPTYNKLAVIPNAVDLSSYAGDFGRPEPGALVFSGALTYHANLDAARYLLGDILPRIVQHAPDAMLRMTGSTAGVDLSALPRHSAAEFTGYVPDIRPVVAQSWAALVPLRLGGGTRLKILEAMALGTPVVSTSKGAEGLDVTDGENILIADSPAEFARRTLDLLRNPELRSRLARGGRRLAADRYDWNQVGHDLRDLVDRAARRPAA